MLPPLFYLSALSLLAGGAAQQTFSSPVALNISSCPITYYGQTYEQIYVNFTGDTFAVCFDNFYQTGGDCLVLPQYSVNQITFMMLPQNSAVEASFKKALPTITNPEVCSVYLEFYHNSETAILALANFGIQSASYLIVNAIGTMAFNVEVNGITADVLNVTNTATVQQNLAFLDLSGCRYSGLPYNPSSVVSSDPATCTTLICDATVVRYTKCGPLEQCQGNGVCMLNNTCTVTGPSVIDFHGQVNSVEDRCAYSLFSSPSDPNFLLLANFQERRRKDVSFLDSVTLLLGTPGVQIHLEQGGRVLLGDTILTLNSSAQLVQGVELSKDQLGVTATVLLPNYTASIFFDGYTAQINVKVPGGEDLALQGLCANSSVSFSGLRVSDYSASGCDIQYTDTPDSTIDCTWATQRCNLLKTAPFTSCNSVVDPEPYITACTNTLCNYPPVDGLDCQFLDTYDRACSLQDSDIGNWWSQASCPPPAAFCPNTVCSDHEFCGEKFVGGETICFCRAIFASKYTSIGALGDPTVCDPDSSSLTLVGCLLEEKGIDYSTLHLNDPTCTGQMNQQTHMVTFSFDNSNTCGAVVKANGSQIIYENTIVSQNTSTDIITRQDQIYIDFTCIQTQPDIKTMSFRIKDNSVVQHITSGAWIYNLTMKAYTDPAFTQILDSSTQVQLDQRIWVQLVTVGLDNSLVDIVTDSCWATSEPSPDGSVRYDLIINGCPNPADQTVTVRGNGLGTSTSFAFNMFQFTGSSGDVYLHCQLHLCVITSNNCVPVCSGGGRRRRAVRSKYTREAAAFITMAWIN